MSGESVSGVGVAAVGIGAVALLGMAAGASCAFVVGRGMEALGSQLERRQAERDAARAVMTEWDRVLQDVALTNGRIGVLAAAQAGAEVGHAGQVSLPSPLVLGTQTPAELRQWCADTNSWLARAEGEVAQLTAQAILRQAGRLAEMADIRIGLDGPGGQADAVAAGPAGTPAVRPGEGLRGDIVRVAGRLLASVTRQEREAVARTAERVLTARSRTEALNRLGDMRVRVDQANAMAASRHRQAAEAARLLQPLAHAGETAQSVRGDLRQVVAGAAPLTDMLRELAQQAAAELQRAADRRYVRDCVTESLAELGYAVDEGFQTAVARNGILQVTRSEWNGHGVRLALDEEKGELRAVVVRTREDGSWDAARVDTERESQWCAAQEKLRAILAAKSITMDVRSLTEPGSQAVQVVRNRPAPAVTAATSSAAPRTGQK
jgi:hypothetical protein